MIEQRELSEQQQEEIGREMVRAAHSAIVVNLGEFPTKEKQDVVSRAIIRAFVEARKAEKRATKKYKAKGGYGPYVRCVASEAVATAFWWWACAPELDIEEISAESVGGYNFLTFAAAMMFVNLSDYSHTLLLFEDAFLFPGFGLTKMAARMSRAIKG